MLTSLRGDDAVDEGAEQSASGRRERKFEFVMVFAETRIAMKICEFVGISRHPRDGETYRYAKTTLLHGESP